MQTAGINVDEAANGVFLPGNVNIYGTLGSDFGPPQAPIHTKDYYDAITLRLSATNPADMRDALQKIAAEIVAGTFPQ